MLITSIKRGTIVPTWGDKNIKMGDTRYNFYGKIINHKATKYTLAIIGLVVLVAGTILALVL